MILNHDASDDETIHMSAIIKTRFVFGPSLCDPNMTELEPSQYAILPYGGVPYASLPCTSLPYTRAFLHEPSLREPPLCEPQ